jgi:cell wall-associated NlpC family hydrolase
MGYDARGPVDMGATMSDGGRTRLRLGRHAPVALVLALLLALAAGTAAAAPKAQPAPNAALAAKAKALQAKLDAQHAEIERIAERLNATDDRRRRLQASLRRLETRQKAAQAELDTAQAQLDEQARATYMGGPQWLLGELVGGANPPDAMRRLPMQKAALEARAAVVTDVRIRKAEVDSLNERLAADLGEANLVHRRQDEERRQVQRLATQLQTTLDKIDEQLAGYLEAEQGRAEASRRAAWAGYMSGVGTVQSWLQAGPVARAAVRWALAQLGDPYRWGATGPDTFDCSGLTSSAYRAAGVSIPRVSRAQWGAGPHVAVANLLPGDLVFYADVPSDPATIHHVGMYIGNGLMVHAPHTGDVVRVASIWRESFAGATRIVPGVVTPGLPGPPVTAPPPTSPTQPTPPPMTTAPPTTKPSPAPPTTRPPTSTSRPGSPATTTRPATTTTAPPTTTTAPPTTAPPATAAPTTAPPTTAAAEPTATEAEPTTTGPPTTS